MILNWNRFGILNLEMDLAVSLLNLELSGGLSRLDLCIRLAYGSLVIRGHYTNRYLYGE